MGPFKGRSDDAAIADATRRLVAGEWAKGVGGQVKIEPGWVTIRHKGTFGVLLHGLPGEKRIPITNVTAVGLKMPGITNGYIHFSVLGNIDRQRGGVFDATRDENSVMFHPGHLPEFLAIRSYVESRLVGGAAAGTPAEGGSVVAELKAIAELRDAGILTEAEFEAKKTELLARL